MNRKEIELPLIMEDLEAGDRVYQHNVDTGLTLFGTIWAKRVNSIHVTMDKDWMVLHPSIQLFDKSALCDTRRYYWGKALSLKDLYPGAIISYKILETDIERFVARIDEVSPDSITFTALADPQAKTTIVATERYSLEDTIKDWTLEE